MPPWLQALVGIFAAGNLLSFCLFGWDKRQARLGGRRVPERRLWLALLLGGWAGGWAGMWVFRHKTRKASFLGPALLCTLPWLIGAGVWLWFATANAR